MVMSIWATPHFIAVVILLGLTGYALAYRPPRPLWPTTVALLCAVLMFALGKAATVFATTPQTYWMATTFSYSGLMVLGTTSWLLAHRFAQACRRPFRLSATRWVYLPSVVVVPVWLGMVTNPFHGQFMTLNMNGIHDHHWIWFLQAGITYLCSTMTFVLYARLIFRVDTKIQRRRILIMLIAPMITTLANLLHLSPATSFPFDPTPIALAVTGSLFLFGIYRVGLFSISPMAVSAMIAQQPNGIVVTDTEGSLLYWNDAASKALRVSLADVDANFYNWLSQHLQEAGGENLLSHAELVRSAEDLPLDAPLPRFCRASDPDHWLQIRIDVIYSRRQKVAGKTFFIRDVSQTVVEEKERMQFERKMLQAQKFESIGLLASGIAHDFNNFLMVIRGNAELLSLSKNLSSGEQEKVKSIEIVSDRAASLVGTLLVSSGEAPIETSQLNYSQLAQDTLELISPALLPKGVVLVSQIESHAWIEGAQSQIVQVLMNLAINAGEAYEGSSGSVDISLRSIDRAAVTPGNSLLSSTSTATSFVLLEVKDSASGMEPESVARISDPFFTSKGAGRGLGLSAVMGIVRSHSGAIIVDSKVGVGTSVFVLFPEVQAVIDDAN